MWFLLQTPPAPGAFNMALDEELMSCARDSGAWILRVYGWSTPTLSLGRNQAARGGYDLWRLAESGIDIVRRPTGGRAILHNREITYAVAAPVDAAGDLHESYGRINRLLVAALSTLGVKGAAVIGESIRPERFAESAPPGLVPCFDHPSMGEITVGGRKIVGSAQWRSDGALLQHGSILVEDDQMHLSSFLLAPTPGIPKPSTLREALGRSPSQEEMADALFAAVRSLEDPRARGVDGQSDLFERANQRVAHYLDDGWTWRR
jgi:lipoate-protein ligase A